MYPIDILSVKIKNNFVDIKRDFIFEIFYEVKKILKKDFELRVTYIISPCEEWKDQRLGVFLISAKKIGKFKMLVNFKPPSWEIISTEEIIGITLIILAFWYGEEEFMRIGYYINNEWTQEKTDSMGKPFVFKSEPIIRAILSDQPRITNYPCFFEGQ